MPIRPMDMQTMLPKIQDINAAKQSVVNKVDNELIEMQKLNGKNEEKKKNSVQELEQKENDSIRNDLSGSNNGGNKNGKNTKNREKKTEEMKKIEDELIGRGNLFDMKV